MKKIYVTILLLVFVTAVSVHAQSSALSAAPINAELTLHKPGFVPQKHFSSPSAQSTTSSFIIDYDSADAYAWGAAGKQFLWNMNMHYTAPPDTAWKYCVVAFDSLYDVYNNIGYASSSVTSVTVDSIYAFVGQENNSGIDDTLRVKIVSVNASGYPTTTVLWTNDMIIPSGTPLSPSNEWLYLAMPSWNPNYTLVSAKKFAVQLEYLGSKQDTMGFLAGFQPRTTSCPNPGATVADPTKFSKAGATLIANSFVYWTQYSPSYGILPTSTGADLYYDCNGNGTPDPGIDGANYMQNINIFAKVTINTTVNVNEYLSSNGLTLMGAYPNPAKDFTTIQYRLDQPSAVSVNVFDMTGRVILNSSEQLSAGTHDVKISLKDIPAGNYYYTIKTNASQLTSKFAVVK